MPWKRGFPSTTARWSANGTSSLGASAGQYSELAARLMGLTDERVEMEQDGQGTINVVIRHVGAEPEPPKETPQK
jgi:hypothetical protein